VHISHLPPVLTNEQTGAPPEQYQQLDEHKRPPEEGFTARMLWRVLGSYGKVVAVKLLFKYPGCAIVQFKNKESAKDVITNLNGLRVFPDQEWEVKESKNANAMHWDGANTELQKRMCTVTDREPPTPALPHLKFRPNECLVMTNLPNNISKESIGKIIETLGNRGPVKVEIENDASEVEATARCVLTFKTTEDALLALGEFNGETYPLGPQGETYECRMHFNRPIKRQPAGQAPADVPGLTGLTPSDGADAQYVPGAAGTPGVGLGAFGVAGYTPTAYPAEDQFQQRGFTA